MVSESPHNDLAAGNPAARDDDWSQALMLVGLHRDQQAFCRLFNHFAPLIKGFCLSNINSHFPADLVEELVQEVMIKVWNKAPSFDSSKSAASTWIYTIMRNARIDFIRRNSRNPAASDLISVDDLWEQDSADDSLLYIQQRQGEAALSRALTQLPIEQKQVLDEVYVLGKTHQEIADETGLPLGTVKSRVRIGLKKLQSIIEEEESQAQLRRAQWSRSRGGLHD